MGKEMKSYRFRIGKGTDVYRVVVVLPPTKWIVAGFLIGVGLGTVIDRVYKRIS